MSLKRSMAGHWEAVTHDRGAGRTIPVAIGEAGLEPPVFINPDGRLHRFSSDGRRGDVTGWYIFHSGDVSAGAFGCWRAGISETWRADIGRKLTKEEVAAHRRQMENARHKREAEEKKLKAKACERAAKIWQRAAGAPEDHPYLARKGIKVHGVKLDHGELVVPLQDSVGVLHSLQFIADDGAKNYLLGGRVSGCFFMIGEPNGALCIAEGLATAASIFECAGIATAVGFNSGNLPPVAKSLRAKFPDAKIIVCADDDAGTSGNPGLSKGREAAEGAHA
jgi:putative DNA primase/helicase